jgi:hypothetical protein
MVVTRNPLRGNERLNGMLAAELRASTIRRQILSNERAAARGPLISST